MQKEGDITIRQLYPEFSDAELSEAEENIERYLALVVRVYDRIAATPKALATFYQSLASDALASMENYGCPAVQIPFESLPVLTDPPTPPTMQVDSGRSP